jgi:SPP1 family predicted phage head-tail adaptor
MKQGELKRTVVFERPVAAQDSAGQEIIEWEPVTAAKAKVEQLSTREKFSAAGLYATATHRITTRYVTTLAPMDATWRVWYRGRAFELAGPPNNLKERNRDLELICTELPADAE